MAPAVLFTVVLAAALSVVADPTIQTKLPGETATASGAPSLPPRRPRDGDPARRSSRAREKVVVQPGALSGVAAFIVWTLLGAGVGLVIVYVAREGLLGARGDPGVGDGAAPDEPAATLTEKPLADAEALAREGRFGEAIHALLLGTLRELLSRTGAGVPRSLTSREIVARVAVSPAGRGALADLVRAVEISHFGGAVPGAADYAACRRQFDVVAGALRA